jgi:hypothetical protein
MRPALVKRNRLRLLAVTVFGTVDPPSRGAKRQGDLGSCDTVHA